MKLFKPKHVEDIPKPLAPEQPRRIPVSILERTDKGTYCKMIDAQLLVSSCPLPIGRCMWKHHVHGLCMYTEEFASSEFTPQAFALRTGLNPLNPGEVNILRERIAAEVRSALT